MRIQVTQEDIDKGCKGKFYACPVARALERDTGMEWGVGTTLACTTDKKTGLIDRKIQLPETVSRFIRNFDFGDKVEPLAFEFHWNPNENQATSPPA